MHGQMKLCQSIPRHSMVDSMNSRIIPFLEILKDLPMCPTSDSLGSPIRVIPQISSSSLSNPNFPKSFEPHDVFLRLRTRRPSRLIHHTHQPRRQTLSHSSRKTRDTNPPPLLARCISLRQRRRPQKWKFVQIPAHWPLH